MKTERRTAPHREVTIRGATVTGPGFENCNGLQPTLPPLQTQAQGVVQDTPFRMPIVLAPRNQGPRNHATVLPTMGRGWGATKGPHPEGKHPRAAAMSLVQACGVMPYP